MIKTPVNADLIRPLDALRNPLARVAWRLAAPAMDPLLKFGAVNQLYRNLQQHTDPARPFFERAAEVTGLKVRVREEDLARIPKSGPVVLVSNHPFGAVDGILMGELLGRVRPDFKLLVNHLLGAIDGIAPWVIQVDPFGGEDAARKNIGPMKECLKFLREGGLLATWPSGTVSHLHLKRWQVMDPPWVPHIASIIKRSGATVVPVYFTGRNSNLFQVLGLISPVLRTALLAREMVNKCGGTHELRIGTPIAPSRLERFATPESLTDFLRLRTYILRNRELAEKTSFRSLRRPRGKRMERVIDPIPPQILEQEIDDLPESSLLVTHGAYDVYCASARQIPNLLLELGRLRELTFREVGEGTGLSCDVDRFDDYYMHLFTWNREKREVVGAYRLGLSEKILPSYGEAGFYSTTLFSYKPGVIRRFSPAIEMGRSFIVAEYQRKHMSLGLLWRGIGMFIVRNPQYRTLFGPVSISREYNSLSKNLMVMYLRENTLDPDFAKLVKARKPPRSRYFGCLDRDSFSRTVRDIDDVSALVSEIEREEKGVPVLLRQYLKLNATILSFNVDPDFNDSLDGLVLVDLTKTGEKTLARYMGEDGVKAFYAYHELRRSEQQALKAAESE